MNEIITTTIEGYEEMDIETTNTCRLQIEIPKGTMEIEISDIEKLSCIKSLISDMSKGGIEEKHILDFVCNGVKLDPNDIIKNIAKIQQAQGGTIQIFGGKNCFSCDNLERFEIRVNGEGALKHFLVDASVEIDNSSLKHIITTLKSQTVLDLKTMIGKKYLEKYAVLPFDWSNLVLQFEGKVLDDGADLLKSMLFEMSEIVVSSSLFESIKMRKLLIVPDRNVAKSMQFKEFELTVHDKFTISMIRKIIAKITNFPDFILNYTALYDGINLASVKLEEYCNASNLQCKKRIIVLSDGDDNKSSVKIDQLTKKLINQEIIVDSFLIGKTSLDSAVRGCSIATGGLQFKPNSIREALSLFEQEPILNLSVREERQKLSTNGRSFNTQFNALLKKPWDNTDSIRIKKESKLELKVKEIHEVPQIRNSTDSVKRICKEITNLLRTPHPFIDTFPSEEDLTFWKILVTGPESTPYDKITFLCYVNFREGYPLVSPEIRFVTPILHPNINHQGRVCHSIFDRNWSPDIKMSELFGVVFGLLLNPDRDDPLDSNLALSFYNDNGQYEANVMSAMSRLRETGKNRDQWKAFLLNDE